MLTLIFQQVALSPEEAESIPPGQYSERQTRPALPSLLIQSSEGHPTPAVTLHAGRGDPKDDVHQDHARQTTSRVGLLDVSGPRLQHPTPPPSAVGKGHTYLAAAVMPSSRASSGSRNACKNCESKKEQWKGHLCLRHASCLDPVLYLWDPDRCRHCFDLLGPTAHSGDDSFTQLEAQTIMKEILRAAEAAATRKGLKGFVTHRVFHERFQQWMGALYDERVIRADTSAPRPTPLRSPQPAKAGEEGTSTASRKEAPPARTDNRAAKEKRPCSPTPTSRGQQLQDLDAVALRKLVQELQDKVNAPASRRSRSRERRSRAGSRHSSTSSSPERSLERQHYLSSRSSSAPSTDHDSPRRSPIYRHEELFGSVSPSPERGREESPEPIITAEMSSSTPKDGLAYYWLPHDTKIGEEDLTLPRLSPIPLADCHVTTIEDRQAVAFLYPRQYPAIDYILRLHPVRVKKESTPSQKEYVRRLGKVVFSNGEGDLSWSLQDPQSPDPAFRLKKADDLEDYAHLISQPKGFGDEASRPPMQPNVPLSSEGPKLQGLLDFLEAAPLSPTSHKLHKRYGDRRSTIDPPKAERDSDHEYRRAARTALGVRLAWSLLEELVDADSIDALTRIKTIGAVLNSFHKDVDASMDYQVTRAVHHRRNLIDYATLHMPQEDIKQAIRDLPLPTGSSLFHESAADTVEASLRRPEGRQLAAIRSPHYSKRRRFQSSTTTTAASKNSKLQRPPPSASKTFVDPALKRKATKPPHPTAPPKRSKSEDSRAKERGGFQPWRKPKSSRPWETTGKPHRKNKQ